MIWSLAMCMWASLGHTACKMWALKTRAAELRLQLRTLTPCHGMCLPSCTDQAYLPILL